MNHQSSLAPFGSVLVLLGCGPTLIGPDRGESTGSTTTGDTTPVGTTRATPLTPSNEDTTAESSEGSSSTATSSFITDPDGGSTDLECDLLDQNCPRGLKCTVWANDGGSAWNATRCVPIAENPVEPGEPCTVEEFRLSGLDDCQLGALCSNIDPKTLEGTCVAQDCAETEACYPIRNHWECITDESGDIGAYGDPCEYINTCDPGLICLGATATPNCVDSPGCCSEICDLSSAEGDAQCTGAPQGQTCQPWYAGAAPPGYENVGACALPA